MGDVYEDYYYRRMLTRLMRDEAYINRLSEKSRGGNKWAGYLLTDILYEAQCAGMNVVLDKKLKVIRIFEKESQ